jgi:pimeloyl-ACP methyl ester carboxylesterase
MRHLSSGGVHALALELPGHGGSPGPAPSNISEYSQIVNSFIDAKGILSPIVVGHSMGGAIALTLGVENPERLGGLILVGTGARLRVDERILNGLHSNFEAAVDRIIGYAFSESSSPALVEEGKRQLMKCRPEVVWGDFKACDEFDLMKEIPQIPLTALVICGKDDCLTPPKFAHYLAENIPSVHLHLVEGAGHMVMIEQPRRMGEAVLEFLQGL